VPELGCPEFVPSATAAIIAGRSRAAFARHFVAAGLVDWHVERGAKLVRLASLETATGRPITCRDFCLAERERDRAREYQKTYNTINHAAVAGTDLPALSRQESPSSDRAAAA
jgi:hypothetical protein